MYKRQNNALTTLSCPGLSDQQEGSVLVIKDSYANALVPYLLYHYEKVVVVDLRYFGLKPRMSEFLQENDFSDILICYNLQNFTHDTDFPRIAL